MFNKKFRIMLFTAILMVSLSACKQGETATPTRIAVSTNTPVASATIEPTSTSTTLPSPTPTTKATAAPTRTITPQPTARVMECPGAPEISLKINDWAMVSTNPPVPNKIRNQPGISGELMGLVQPGKNVLVVDGPQCADGYTWWLVRSLDGLEGWTVEGDAEGYWLVDPIYAWYKLPKPLTSQGSNTYDLRELKISADRALVSDITGNYNPLATPLPRPQTEETPEPNDPRYSMFGTASYAAHSFYDVSGIVGENFWIWVYELDDPLSRYYLNHTKDDDCTKALQNNLRNPTIVPDYLRPFCGINGAIPLLFKASVKPIQFTGGEGVRYLIASGNYQTVNHLVYHFQGLSDDGRYYINGIFRPILHPYIIEDELYKGDFGWLLEWKDGQYEEAQKSYDLFNARIEELLNADAVNLYPSLDFLDAMMESIVMK